MTSRRPSLITAVAVVCLLGTSSPSLAAPGDAAVRASTAAETGYMKELERIAAQPQAYQATDTAGAPAGQVTTAAARQLDPYRCTLYPSVVHSRKSGNWNTVGAKPYTRCTAGTPRSIQQSSTLYMVEWAGLSYRQLDTDTASTTYKRDLVQKNVAWQCKNKNRSRFNQQTKGVSIQAGRTWQTAVQTPIVTLECGK